MNPTNTLIGWSRKGRIPGTVSLLAHGLTSLCLALSCGTEPAKEKVEKVALVFDAGYLDVQGPIEIRIDGHPPVLMDRAEQFSCEAPAFWIDPEEAGAYVEISAYSERHFTWLERIPAEALKGCISVDLGHDNLKSGLMFFAQDGRSDCLPVDFYLAFGGQEERHIGTLSKLLSPSSTYKLEDYSLEDYSKLLHEAARDGKLILVGGGEGYIRYLTRAEGPCGNGKGGGVSVPHEQILGIEVTQ